MILKSLSKGYLGLGKGITLVFKFLASPAGFMVYSEQTSQTPGRIEKANPPMK